MQVKFMNKAFLNPKKSAEIHSKGVVGSYATNMRGLFITFLKLHGCDLLGSRIKGKFSISFKLTYLFTYLLIYLLNK